MVEVPGFIDASAVLRGGVYILAFRGEVVYVGRASGSMLAKLANLRSTDRPSWLPRIRFDQILLRSEHPDRIDALRLRLIVEFEPKHNADKLLQATAALAGFERRI
jgi:hypothetical protein